MTSTITCPYPVGTSLDEREQMTSLPIGAVIKERNGSNRWQVTAPGVFNRLRGGELLNTVYREYDFSLGYNEIESLPDGCVIQPPPLPTLKQFQWGFRQGSLFGAYSNSIRREYAEAVLTRLHIGPDAFEVGPQVLIKDPPTVTELPPGTVLFTGQPDFPASFGVFTVSKSREVVPVLGKIKTHGNYPLVIEQIPGGPTEPPDWWQAVGTEEDTEQIAEFKARAWRLGGAAKKRHSWCSTYESVMQGLGVTAESLRGVKSNGYGVGDRISTRAHIAALPVGSVIKWTHEEHSDWFCYYVRTADATNECMTRRAFGYRGDGVRLGQQASGTLMAIGLDGVGEFTDPLRVSLTIEPHFGGVLPAGTQFRFYENHAEQTYEWNADGRVFALGDNHPYRLRDYGANDTLYISKVVPS